LSEQELAHALTESIRDVPDYPKPGILFKDITPVLANPELSLIVSHALKKNWSSESVQGVIGVESRGFIYGLQLAQQLHVPFIPVRKAGKLPFRTIKHAYELEYGSAEMEMHVDAVHEGQKILIHDDLLATGGTAAAAAELVRMSGGAVAGFSFLVEIDFLKGRELLNPYSQNVHSLVHF
jgi:adenine phosphoribosyltransferase